MLSIGKIRRKIDSWYNSQSKFGGTGDQVINSAFFPTKGRVNRYEAESLFEHDWLTAKGVSKLPEDATKKWIALTHDTDPDKAEKLRLEDIRLDGSGLFRQGGKWGRLHGGALLVMGAWDGGAPDMPLQLDKIKKVNFTNVVDRWMTYPQEWGRDPNEADFGTPSVYRVHRLSPIGGAFELVHSSRVIRFDGFELPPLAALRNFGWHASVIDRVYDATRNWGIANQAAAAVIPKFITYALKVEGLKDLLAHEDFGAIAARTNEFLASINSDNFAMIGDGEELIKLGTPIAGLPELLDKMMETVSGAWGYPKSVLFQAESGGLGGNAADTDQDNYHGTVAAYQTSLIPLVRRWLDIIGAPLGIKPGEVDFTFNPLSEMSDLQKADLYYKTLQGDQIAISTQMVEPEALAVVRFGGQKFSSGLPVLDTERQEKYLEQLKKEPIEPEEDDGDDTDSDNGAGGDNPDTDDNKKEQEQSDKIDKKVEWIKSTSPDRLKPNVTTAISRADSVEALLVLESALVKTGHIDLAGKANKKGIKLNKGE